MPGLLVLGETGGAEGVGTHPGCPLTPLHSGSKFKGHQQSKGNKYQVEVVFQVCPAYIYNIVTSYILNDFVVGIDICVYMNMIIVCIVKTMRYCCWYIPIPYNFICILMYMLVHLVLWFCFQT